MNVKVTIDGMGEFFVPSERVHELVQWLQSNQASQVVSHNEAANPDGKTLLNG